MAPFEERGDARQSGRSAGRLESIDCYRWPRIRSSVLCYPILLHGTPLHSHSIVLSDRNALNLQRNIFRTCRRTVSPIRQKSALLISNRNFRRSAVRSVSVTIGVYRSIFSCRPTDQAASRFSKKTVTRPRITRARHDTDIEPVERRLADARYLLLSRRHDKATGGPLSADSRRSPDQAKASNSDSRPSVWCGLIEAL
jgi:hypothetical protein